MIATMEFVNILVVNCPAARRHLTIFCLAPKEVKPLGRILRYVINKLIIKRATVSIMRLA